MYIAVVMKTTTEFPKEPATNTVHETENNKWWYQGWTITVLVYQGKSVKLPDFFRIGLNHLKCMAERNINW